MLYSSSSHPGLTRIDVVVLLIVGSLTLTLSGCWFSTVRTPVPRTQSLNNLRQIALATHNWASSQRDANSLPHASFVQKTTTGHELVGPYAAILPQMEQLRIFDEGSPNDIIKNYLSPHDSSVKDVSGRASYAWNGGWIVAKKGEATLAPEDGAANTILLCERVMLCNGSANRWSGKHPGAAQDWNGTPYLPGVTVANENTFATSARPPAWASNAPVKSSSTCDSTTPSGSHFGIILVVMGDGSTRTVTRTAGNEKNWSAAITPTNKDDFDTNW